MAVRASRGSSPSDSLVPPALSVRAQVHGDHACVEIAGEIDLANACEVEEQLNALQPLDHGRTIVVDCSEVGFMDASGLSAFLRAQSFARHHDGDIVIARPSRNVLLVLEVTGLDGKLTGGDRRRDG